MKSVGLVQPTTNDKRKNGTVSGAGGGSGGSGGGKSSKSDWLKFVRHRPAAAACKPCENNFTKAKFKTKNNNVCEDQSVTCELGQCTDNELPDIHSHWNERPTQNSSISVLKHGKDDNARRCLSTNLNAKPLPRHLTKSDNDNKITIKISYDDDIGQHSKTTKSDHKPKRPQYPVKISSDRNGITKISTTYGSCSSLTQHQYNESAIDVPEDFEREAYAKLLRNSDNTRNYNQSPFKRILRRPAHLSPTLKDFLQEEWIKIDEDRDRRATHSFEQRNEIETSRRHSATDIMGAKYSTNFRKFGKHSIAPTDDSSIHGNIHQMNCLQEGIENENICLDPATNVSYRIDDSKDYVHENSIMQRTREIFSAGKQRVIRDHIDYYSNCPTSRKKGSTINGSGSGSEENYKKNQYRNLYHRLGGSIQNLVGANSVSKKFSASEGNLNRIQKENNINNSGNSNSSSNSRFRFSGDYYPSAFFNRFTNSKSKQTSNISTDDGNKNFSFGKIKNFLSGNLARKPKEPPKDRRQTIQDLDGGFFEKFGSLLRQKSEIQEEKICAPLAPLDGDIGASNARALNTIEEGENDSGTETLQESDSDSEDLFQQDLLAGLVGWNIEELYEEILCEIIHNVGCENDNETCRSALFSYVQDAFKIVNERHEELLKAAELKEPPEIRLNIEVIEAKELKPKDPNGLSDPFVTMFIASNPTHRYNTSVKGETLSPIWEEHFSLPVNENPNDENLIIEVWDFDPAETVGEKMTKFFDVKGVKGFKKLMKEIAVTASTGKHDNEMIGRCNIPLRTIPASGLVMWFSLEKKNKVKRQGLIKVRLTFSAEKNNKVAAQEHRHLLRILLMHELDTSKVAPYWWSGKFSVQGESVITQHSAQSALTPIDCALAQWSVYTAIHNEHPLAFNLFETILDKLIRPVQTFNLSDEDLKAFWDGVRKLLPSCFSIIRKIRKKTNGEKNSLKILSDVLTILSKIALLEPPAGTDLFPKSIYGWLRKGNNEPNWDIHGTLEDAVNSGAQDWFNHINETNSQQHENDEEILQQVVKVIQLVRSDLQRGIEYYDKVFQEKMHFPYSRTCYVYYEEKLTDYIEPIINDVCKKLKRLSLPDDRYKALPEHEEVNMGTTLFELYLVLKRFVMLGDALSPVVTEFKINQYHLWFTPGVAHWLDISVYKALIRIEKAIELDQLIPVDDTVKYTSSAVDTLAIFYQIKIFWQQLDWPDVEGSYMFVGKIVDDICRCCLFYADRMSTKVEGMGEVQNVYENKFEVTREWCLAINNIDYIRQSLMPFVKELKIEEIISKLAEFRTSMEAERCSQTLKNVVENAIDTEKNKILELIENVARRMSPPMRRFLIEGAELLHQDSNSMDRLMMYLEDSLKTLNSELNEVNFERILDAIWIELSHILYELVQTNIDKRRPPSFFANLRETLRIMVKSFKCGQNSSEKSSSDKETLETIERLLELHGYETSDLIHQYYLERVREQEELTDTAYGQLTVKCCFRDNAIEIEVMNARNLIPMDSNGLCDPFVRIHFVPEEKFHNVVKPRTNAQNKTLFPLFDEKFIIPISPEQRAMNEAIVLFSVKDKDLFGMSNQYIAECYLLFKNIAVSDEHNEQIHLLLSRPTKPDTDCIRALEYRQGDKQAKEFMKKLKQKMGNP